MRLRTLAPTLEVLTVLVVSACSVLAPIPDRSRYYTLTPPAAPERSAETTAATAASPVVYGLGPITLAPYLDRNQIVTRLSPTEVAYAQWDRWAEPLRESLATALRQTLWNELGTEEILMYPWAGTSVDYQIGVAFERFETETNGDTRLVARWLLRDVRRDRAVVRRETSATRATVPGDRTASTAALSAMVGDLGHEIAEAIRDLPPPSVPRKREK
jgi:uncharacterized lipoprotein YmbA